LRDIAENNCVALNKPVKVERLSQVIQQLLEIPQSVTREAVARSSARPSGANATATVFLVDDHRDVRDAMQILLTKAGYSVKVYASAKDFLNSYHPGSKGCLITDVRMPGMGGFELLAQLTAAGNGLPAIVITGQGNIATAVQAMKAGAVDFIEKPIKPDALLACVDRALRQVASPAERSAWRKAAAMRHAGLTKREREVMEFVIAGHANKKIATGLGISQRTVETHRATVMKKMGANSLPDLVRLHAATNEKFPAAD
jgi:two-component system CheB/CheR fusion protein